MEVSKLTRITLCACHNIRMAARAITQMYDEALKPSGLKVTQFSLLSAISMAGPVPITVLAEKLVMDRTTLTRNLNVIERKGFIDIESDIEDSRTRLIRIAPQGEVVLEQAVPLWEQAQAKVVEGMGKESFNNLLGLLSEAAETVADR